MELLRRLPSDSIRTAFFDPQYRGVLDTLAYGNEGEQRGQRRAALPQMDVLTIIKALDGINRVLEPSGHLFLWMDKFHICEGTWTSFWTGRGVSLVDLVTWDKGTFGMGYRTRRACEYLIVIQKHPKRARGKWTDHTIPDVWTETVSTEAHPHVKPMRLQTALIEATTAPGDVVLDPAAGSFSVLTAATALGRRFIGGDLRG